MFPDLFVVPFEESHTRRSFEFPPTASYALDFLACEPRSARWLPQRWELGDEIPQIPLNMNSNAGQPGSEVRKFFLVDGHAYGYQAFYGAGGLQTPGGTPVGAVFGFTQLIEKLLAERPTHFAVVFDSPQPTFRSVRFPDYKIQRSPMPEELAEQFPVIKEMLQAYRIPCVEAPTFEADDLIATLAKRASEEKIPTFIVSRDKDFEQLIDGYVRIYNPRDGECLDTAGLVEKKGLRPDQVIDFLALAGDASDNVPGVEGVGPKTALKILAAVSRFEEIFTRPIPGLSPKVQEKLRSSREIAELSRELVTLDSRCPVPGGASPDVYRRQEADRDALLALFRRLHFLRLLEKHSGNPAQPGPNNGRGSGASQGLLPLEPGGETVPPPPASVATASPAPSPPAQPLPSRYFAVLTRSELESLVERLLSSAEIAVDTETTGLNPFRDELVGLSFAMFAEGVDPSGGEAPSADEATARQAPVEAFYVPLRAPAPLELSPREILDALRPVLEGQRPAKLGQNVKFDALFYRNAGIRVEPLRFDTMIASYLLNPEVRAHNIDSLSLEYLGHQKITTESLIGTGKNQIRMDQVALEKIRDYACEDVDVVLRLEKILAPRLVAAGLESLFRDVEMPLVEVLIEMEMAGITVDVAQLQAMGKRIRGMIDESTRRIHELAGSPFNIASPPQLAEVLYGKLGLPPGPKGKSGVPSTAADVLADLRDRHPIVPLILEHRELTKLLGTYVEALPELVEPRTGRIHTSFNQTVAATGRLSSSNPNLQNIPIKTDLGREIRKAFIARDRDHVLLSADYSQVELRILAHLSEDAALIEAFRRGDDIHRQVAARIHGVAADQVTPAMRRFAKSVNFGIVYGMTPFGLSDDLGIGVDEAAAIIRGYFERHPGVKGFVDRTLDQARREGFVRTILGRRRPIRDIDSRNQRLRGLAERTAVNTVVQGSAADLIKVAMNNIHTDFVERKSRARLLLQIHDELVFELPRLDLEVEAERIRREMAEAMELRVPIEVDTVSGESWFEEKE